MSYDALSWILFFPSSMHLRLTENIGVWMWQARKTLKGWTTLCIFHYVRVSSDLQRTRPIGALLRSTYSIVSPCGKTLGHAHPGGCAFKRDMSEKEQWRKRIRRIREQRKHFCSETSSYRYCPLHYCISLLALSVTGEWKRRQRGLVIDVTSHTQWFI